MLPAILIFTWLVGMTTANQRCMKYCASENHFYDVTVIQTIQQKTERYCATKCRKLAQCEGFNYDSAAATCHLINSAHNLTPAAGRTAWSVKLCAGMCRLSEEGSEYLGKVSTTENGRTCQRWDTSTPHNNWYADTNLFLEGDPRENYCRNPLEAYGLPPRSATTLWCYTIDPNVRWEKCSVSRCDEC